MSLDWNNAIPITGSDGNEYTAALLPCGNVGFGIWQHPGGKYLVSVLEGDQVRVAGSAKQGSFELAKLNAEAFYFDQAAGWLLLDRMGLRRVMMNDRTGPDRISAKLRVEITFPMPDDGKMVTKAVEWRDALDLVDFENVEAVPYFSGSFHVVQNSINISLTPVGVTAVRRPSDDTAIPVGPPGKHHGDKTHGWIVQGGAS